ncbi:uncharacterized protein C2845_PM16G12180 [Panicum miliaceum]|uniref:Uncharacterized protein n=1 Tax=Panicum miliaceum TaxID=4540 RepID=A0A3L6PVZ2_PANMI|nr:uncharacterized protein C2845_PM16G12180 [Panicum miliaceum]
MKPGGTLCGPVIDDVSLVPEHAHTPAARRLRMKSASQQGRVQDSRETDRIVAHSDRETATDVAPLAAEAVAVRAQIDLLETDL